MLQFRIVMFVALALPVGAVAAERPNVVWISTEDISPHLGCYGDPHAKTPTLDQLAAEGVRYTHAYSTAGVCAPSRSAIITGIMQTSLGTQHMRGNATLPPEVRPFPMLMRAAGYYCTNNSKTDYQFKAPKETWDNSSSKAHWRNRKNTRQPFFAVFNFTGTHESSIASAEKYKQVTKDLKPSERQQADKLTTFPPYYPDTPEAREDWKRNYELITALDHYVANILQQLEEDGLAEETIVFFWSDHGVGLPRAKRWLYDSGTHVPLIVRIPDKFRVNEQGDPGTVSDQLVSLIDLGPTVLNLIGVTPPAIMQGVPFLGPGLPPARDYVFGARDRMDERYDIIRMVRDHRYKYIRNYEPLKTYYQFMNTAEAGPTMQSLREGHAAGTLPAAAEYYFSPTKPVEELYDCENDPHELHNLANDLGSAEVLKRLREVHLNWVKETRDTGLLAEPILVEQEQRIGHRYGILRGTDADEVADHIALIANLASSGPQAIDELLEALQHPNAGVRYWAATGLGNLGSEAAQSKQALQQHLNDASPVVQIAAARALANMGSPEVALPILTRHLQEGQQWERLHAAIVLDEMDEQARPVIEEMRLALEPRRDLYAEGKYVVRVINRALNQLEGTHRQVP